MTDLAQLKMPLPFSGRSGSDKKHGCCPHCAAGYQWYRYPDTGRWKHCYACGYDRLEEKLLRGAVYMARRGRIVAPDTFERVVRYHDRVYGQK